VCTSTAGEMGQRDSASTPLPAEGVKKRAPRRHGRERRRYSTARILLEQTNAGKSKTHPDRLTLKEAAAKAGLCGCNVIQKQLNPPTREAFLAEAQRDEPDVAKLLDIHLKTVDQFEQLYTAVHGFVRDAARIPRAGDVYDIKGGLTSDAALERLRLGKENVARKQEMAQTNREAKRKKFDIEYETALEVFAAKKAELASEDDLNELTKSVLSQIYLAIFGHRALQNHSKAQLVLGIAGKLFEENIKNNLADEGMDQLPDVPVAEQANT